MDKVKIIVILLVLLPYILNSEEKLQFTNTYNPRVFSYTLKKEESNLFSFFMNSAQDEYKEFFEIDAKLCAAARYSSIMYAKKSEIPNRLETTALRPLLWSYGIYDFQFLPTAFVYKTEEGLKDSLKSYLHIISKRGFFNCGIGITDFNEEKKIATIICSKRVVEAFDIPKIMTEGSYLNLNFTIRSGYKEPVLFYSPPSGDVTKKKPAISEKGEYYDSYALDGGAGKYLVQIVVRGNTGVEPVLLIPIYAGVPMNEIKKELMTYINLVDNTKNVSVEEAKDMLLKAINYERKKMRLNSLTLNPALSKIAQEKSKLMAEKQLFGHEVTEKKIEDMLKENKIKFGGVAENIGINSSPRMAHFLFMSSPSHRANILNSIYNEVGIGIYKAGKEEPQWFITEIFLMGTEF